MRKTPNGYTKEVIVETLEKYGPQTAMQLADMTDMKFDTVYANLMRMTKEGEAYIGAYSETWPPSAIFSLGRGFNVPRPAKKPRKKQCVKITKAEANAQWARTPGLPTVYPVKSIFAGGVSPWAK